MSHEPEESLELQFKCVIIGDGAVGKTSLLFTWRKREFPKEYVPTVFDGCCPCVKYNGQDINIDIWDTAGAEEFDRLRALSYRDAHVILICFSVNNRNSFRNIEDRWIPEMRHYSPDVTFLIIGCKDDLRDDQICSTREQLNKLILGYLRDCDY